MSLQVWLPLTGTLVQQGLSNVAATNTGCTVASSGKLGSCYSFNGSSNYLAVNITYASDSYSYCCWAYFTKFNVHLMDARNSSGVGDQPMYVSASGVQIGGSATSFQTISYSFSTNTWYHLAVVQNSAGGSLYVNGTLVSTIAAAKGYNYNGVRELRIGTRYSGANWFGGLVNDVRFYDHALSTKEVRELSKALVLHYKLDDPYVESTTNLVPIPVDTGAANYAWDASLHARARTVSGWGGGYNSGVGTPASGYHACWRIIENRPTMVYQNINSDYGMTGRWLGISSTACYPVINAGETYTISFEMMTVGKRQANFPSVFGGWYYKLTSSASSRSFHDGYFYLSNTKIGAWEKVSVVKTRASGFDNNSDYQAFYIYGQSSTEGIMYVRNVQVEKKDHATPFTGEAATAANGSLIVYDSSGYGYNGSLVSGRNLYVRTDTPRYTYSTEFPFYSSGTGNYVSMTNSTLLATLTTCTVCWWGKYNVAKSLLLTGQSTSYYLAAGNPSFYHQNVTVSKYYVDGVQVSSAPSYVAGAWHHYAIVCKLSNFTKIMLNNYGSADTWSINGKISDFRIYAGELTANDVAELYHTEVAVDRNSSVFEREVIER